MDVFWNDPFPKYFHFVLDDKRMYEESDCCKLAPVCSG